MSLSLDQLFLSPNEEKKVQLQNRPYIGDDNLSSDDCSEEESRGRPPPPAPQQVNHNSRKSVNYKSDLSKNEPLRAESSLKSESCHESRTESHAADHYSPIGQSKDQTNQSSYAAFSSSQILRNSKEMSNNLANYPGLASNIYKSAPPANKPTDRIKFRKSVYNDDYEQRSNQPDELFTLSEYRTDSYGKADLAENRSAAEFKGPTENDLINRKPASALIKRGNLFKNVDYFNRPPELDDTYSNRKTERRKARKSNVSSGFPEILQPEVEIFPSKEQSFISSRDYFGQEPRMIERKDKSQPDTYDYPTRFVNTKRNYSHFIHKDSNSKRASISSAEISKYDTLSSSSSASPIQDRKADLNDIICIKNNYVGYNFDDVMTNLENLNKKKRELNYSSANSSILDEENGNLILDSNLAIGKAKSQQPSKAASSKVNALNDLLTIETDDLSRGLISNDQDVLIDSFSSSIMHKSSKLKASSSERKCSVEKDFDLVDLINAKDEPVEKTVRESSPELLKFNEDEDYFQQQAQFVNKSRSDLLTADDGPSSPLNERIEGTTTLISNAQSVLQPKLMNFQNESLMDDLKELNEINEQDELDGLQKESDNELVNVNVQTIQNIQQINSLVNEIELDAEKDDSLESDDQNEMRFSQIQIPNKVQKLELQRRSSGDCSDLKEFNQKDDLKEPTLVYSNDLKIGTMVNSSQLNSPTSSESSTFNSTVVASRMSQTMQSTKQQTSCNAAGSTSSLEGASSPKRSGLKTPGYTQRILNNSNSEQVKYGLFQLGANSAAANLIDIDSEQRNEEEAKRSQEEEPMSADDYPPQSQSNKQSSNQKQSMPRDISREELVKSILNIPAFSLDQDENEDDLNSSQNSNQQYVVHNGSHTVSHAASHTNKSSSSYANRTLEQQPLASELEKLNLSSDNGIRSTVTNRNASLGDIRLSNNSSACKQLKETPSNVNNSRTNLRSSRQSSNTSLEQPDCLDLVLDKSLSNNLNFVSNSMSSSSLLSKPAKLANGRLPDYALDNGKTDAPKNKDQQLNLTISIDNEPSTVDKFDSKSNERSTENLDKNDSQLPDKEELLVDTSDLTTPSSANQFNSQPNSHLQNHQQNHQPNKSNYARKTEPYGQMQSKLLQDSVANHLLSDSLVEIADESYNSNQFDQQQHNSNKKSPKKHRGYNNSVLCYVENNNSHSRYDKSYSRSILNSKFSNQHQISKASEDSVRNFSLSPETTDCDSVEVESEFSISSFVSVPGLNQMPILEDGLSSGSASDTETSQTAKLENDRLKKQAHQQNKLANNESPEMELFAKCRPRIKKNQHMSDYDLNSENYNCDNLNQSDLCDDRLVDGRPHLKKSRSLNNNNMHLNGLDSSEAEHTNDALTQEQLWNSKQQAHPSQQPQSRGHLDYNQAIGCENQSDDNEVASNSLLKLNDEKPPKLIHEDDCDTDQETDRLLGAQRADERPYFDDKKQPIKKKANSNDGPTTKQSKRPSLPRSVLIEGVLFRARYLGSTQLICEGQPTKATRMMQAEEAVSRIKAPEGETQPSTDVDLFISTEKIMVLNTDLRTIMMDHSLRTISYIADIGDLLVLMARRKQQISTPTTALQNNEADKLKRIAAPKMICHVFESDEAQFIAQSIGQAFQVAYMEFLKANGIEDSSFIKEMDYQEVLNSQEIFGNELEMFARKEKQKEVIVPKKKGEILGMVIVESGWGSLLPTVVIANMAQQLPAARCGALNIGDQIIEINGNSLVGLPLSQCQNYIKNAKNQTVVKLTVVPCAPVVEVKIKRPDTKYQLGFSVQNGVICSLLRGGIAERGGVRVGHRIIEINGQSVVAVPHERIVNLLATSVGEIHMKTMPTSMFRLLTGQEIPNFW